VLRLVARRTPAPSATRRKMSCEVKANAASAPIVTADKRIRAGIGRMSYRG
jgi:hypothetical protein